MCASLIFFKSLQESRVSELRGNFTGSFEEIKQAERFNSRPVDAIGLSVLTSIMTSRILDLQSSWRKATNFGYSISLCKYIQMFDLTIFDNVTKTYSFFDTVLTTSFNG